MEDVCWVTEAPEFTVDGDGVKVTLTSGHHEHTFQISRRLARTAILVLGRLLDEAERDQRIFRLEQRRQSET